MGCAAPNPIHWQDLRSRDSKTILQRAGVELAPDDQAFLVSFLNARYLIDPANEVIRETGPEPDRILNKAFQITLLGYLIAPPGGDLSGKVITEKELPGGPTFFQGPHALPVWRIIERFGSDPDGFIKRGRELGGSPIEHGDAALQFTPFGSIPVSLVLWRADDEFPASVSVLFDKSISKWFELDMVFLTVSLLIDRLVED
jgi:uncharacterized protein DUF3786